MLNFLKNIAKANEGQALLLVLIFLLVAALVVPASVAYMGTSLKAKIATENKLDELYAADAGIEYALCHIKEGEEVPSSLPQTVNGKAVTLLPVEPVPCEEVPSMAGYYHSYREYYVGGKKEREIKDGTLSGALEIHVAIQGWSYDYLYTIEVTNDSEEPVPLTKLVACLPALFVYRSCSGYSCDDNITYDYPTIKGGGGAYWTQKVTWELDPPVMIAAGETKEQNFWMKYEPVVGGLPPGYPGANAPPSPHVFNYYTLGDCGTDGDILVITAEAGNTTLEVCAVKWLDTEEMEDWRSMFPDLKVFSILSWEYGIKEGS